MSTQGHHSTSSGNGPAKGPKTPVYSGMFKSYQKKVIVLCYLLSKTLRIPSSTGYKKQRQGKTPYTPKKVKGGLRVEQNHKPGFEKDQGTSSGRAK